jgi:tRNA(Leu) C34 or U34 (ribose-2'-O)-methylase TrmL
MFQLMTTVGIAVAQLVNLGTAKADFGWRVSLALAGVPAIALTLAGLFLPDTPNSLAARGKPQEARRVLARLRGTEEVDAEFDDIQAAVKASAGTLEYLPVAQVTNVVTFLLRARDAGFWIYGAAGEAAASYLRTDLTGRIVIVAGAEGRGLRPLVARTCDALVSIPMDPSVESLNVSVAAALLLYEARRQREAAAGS